METVEELEAILATDCPPIERINALVKLKTRLRGRDFSRSHALCTEAVELASAIDEPLLEAHARRHLGSTLWRMGRSTEAQEELAKSLRIFQEHRCDEGLAHAYCTLGIVHGTLNDVANALDFFEKSLAAAHRWGDEATEAHTVGNIGTVHFKLEDYPTALRFFARSLAISRNLGEEGLPGVSNMLGSIAGVLVIQGEYDKAIEHLEDAISIDRITEDLRGTATRLLNLGITYAKKEEYDTALGYLKQSFDLGRKNHFRALEHMLHEHFAEVYRALGDHGKALEHMEKYNELMIEQQRMEVSRKADSLL